MQKRSITYLLLGAAVVLFFFLIMTLTTCEIEWWSYALALGVVLVGSAPILLLDRKGFHKILAYILVAGILSALAFFGIFAFALHCLSI